MMSLFTSAQQIFPELSNLPWTASADLLNPARVDA